jgi:hypothetical protein
MQTKEKISKSLTGKKQSEETINKRRGKPAWNKGLTGIYSEETRKKISEANRKRGPHSEEHKQKIRDSNKGKNKGKYHSEETKEKIRNSLKGRIFSEERKTKLKGRTAWNKGLKGSIVWSDDSKKKLSLTNKGKPSKLKGRHLSEDHKKKIGDAGKGKKRSKEFCEDVQNRMKGHIPSDVTRQKMSEAKKGKLPWNKGVSHTEETKQKMRDNHNFKAVRRSKKENDIL